MKLKDLVGKMAIRNRKREGLRLGKRTVRFA